MSLTYLRNLKIAKIIIHEDYCVGNNEYDHDIALVKLKEKVDVSIHTPACLPPKDVDYSGKLASVYGWGATKTPQTHPKAAQTPPKSSLMASKAPLACGLSQGVLFTTSPNQFFAHFW